MKFRAISFGVMYSAVALLIALCLAFFINKLLGENHILPPPSAEIRSYYDEELTALHEYHKKFLDEMKKELQSKPSSDESRLLMSRYFKVAMSLFGFFAIALSYMYIRKSRKWEAVGCLSFSAMVGVMAGIIYLI